MEYEVEIYVNGSTEPEVFLSFDDPVFFAEGQIITPVIDEYLDEITDQNESLVIKNVRHYLYDGDGQQKQKFMLHTKIEEMNTQEGSFFLD